MSIFKKAEFSQAYLKAGFLGLQGSGKTYTAVELMIGLILYARKAGIESASKPVAFFDTETGSDWMIPRFKEAGIDLVVSRSRSMIDLRDGMYEASKDCSGLIIDSITHYWTKFCDEYCIRLKRRFGLEVWDWNVVKREWREYFADPYVNLPLHIVMCGRQGYEYETEVSDSGKKETVKSGVKMKAEGETGFEPSILVNMERVQDFEGGELRGIYRVAHILKDRSTLLDGKRIKNPTFESFMPHVRCLTLGGTHQAIEQRDNAALFTPNGQNKASEERAEKDCVLEEINEIVAKHHSGRDDASKEERKALLEKHFGTRAWSRVCQLDLKTLHEGRNALWLQLDGVPYAFAPPDTSKILQPGANDPPKAEAAA